MSDAGYRVLVHRKNGTTEHALREGREITFGRDADCDVSLADARVSRKHATLRMRGGSLELADLGSRNGSSVDGERIAPNVLVPVRPTSVVRIGDAVLVFEQTSGRTGESWVFDGQAFEKRAAAIMSAAKAKKAVVGVIEIRFTSDGATRTTITSGGTPPVHLQQLLSRIVGPDGVIDAHDSGRLVLVIPGIDAEKLDVSAALLKRLCEENKLGAEVRTASSAEAQSVQVLLLQTAKGPGAPIPPVIFRGGKFSIDKLLSRLDASDSPVLIVGETGVGKDVLARSLHARSNRANKPFVALNCAAFTEALFESELFGHERGAFTGAATAKTGLLESASGGTVFLDEIGEMPLGLQAKLLRVVENREVLRVGALQPKQIDVRFVFATNRDLRKEIEQKAFRSDLFFRIGSITLRVPPLRERVDEIVPLAQHFIEAGALRIGRPVPRLLGEAQKFLEGHAWPGNVRELKNVIDLALLVHEGGAIRPVDVHIERYIPVDAAESAKESDRSVPVEPDTGTRPRIAPAPSSGRPDPKTEREMMLDALERAVWNQTEAAKLLGMPRRTFVKRLAQYDLPRPRKRES